MVHDEINDDDARTRARRGRTTAAENGAALADPSPALFKLFSAYARRYVRRHFHAVRLAGPAPAFGDARGPVVVYLNHPAWWDPLTCLLVAARVFPGRRHHAPIDARALRQYGFFHRLGFFGVEPGTHRGGTQFLRAGLAILGRPDAVLWVTAEGAFRDPRERPVRLQPGLARLLCRTDANPVVLPLAVEYPFWEERTPEALVRFGEPVDVAACSGLDVAEMDVRLAVALEATMDQLAADSMSRDHARFETLLGGRAGVGGAYDLWRRLKAFTRREPFRAEHGGRA